MAIEETINNTQGWIIGGLAAIQVVALAVLTYGKYFDGKNYDPQNWIRHQEYLDAIQRATIENVRIDNLAKRS